jgi:hypothetical protein
MATMRQTLNTTVTVNSSRASFGVIHKSFRDLQRASSQNNVQYLSNSSIYLQSILSEFRSNVTTLFDSSKPFFALYNTWTVPNIIIDLYNVESKTRAHKLQNANLRDASLSYIRHATSALNMISSNNSDSSQWDMNSIDWRVRNQILNTLKWNIT